MSFEDTEFENEKFFIEVSTRYHDYRRATLGQYVTLVRLISLVGSIGALLAVSTLAQSSEKMVNYVAFASILIAIVNLLDLVFQVDSNARLHTSLYQRFKALQEEMARNQGQWRNLLPEWQAKAQLIRIDEPPTYWAVYARAWNQTAEKYGKFGDRHPIKLYQRILQDFVQFRPDGFGLAVVEHLPQ